MPHRAARRLVRARNARRATPDQVGLISLGGSSQDPVRYAITDGAEAQLAEIFATLALVRVRQEGDWAKVTRLTREASVDAWIVYGPLDDEGAAKLGACGLPYVVVGDHGCTRPVHSVNIDNLAIGRMVAQHFASLGHRRVAYLATGLKRQYQQVILDGFRAARRELGLDMDERLIVDKSSWPRNDVAVVLEWLQSHDPMPTAVFIPEFGVAIGVYPVLKRSTVAGLREMSFLSCGVDPPHSAGCEFTSVDPRMVDVGREGVLLLHRLIMEGHAESVLVAPGLFAGQSTRPPM